MRLFDTFGGAPRVLALLFVLLLLAAAVPAEAYLSYNTSSALKKAGCSGDADGDCLDDSIETGLAWAVSPWYFYDEDEGCSGWENDFGQPSYHFARRDYVQVRPHDRGVWNWTSTDGRAKWVTVSFFFLYPHDCGNNFGFAGHQGDSERVRFYLYSYNLTTWYLSYAYYDHHGRSDYVSGSFLQSKAQDLGTSWASVAADEDKHGSWAGKEVGSSHCAGSQDDFCLSTCDCFQNTWSWDYYYGYYDLPSGSRNVGGPWPEQWKTTYVTVSGSDAYTQLDVGHGLNREYWTDESGTYGWFCGWECPIYYRLSNGHCAVNVHNRSNCAEGPLSDKVDYYDFSSLSAVTTSSTGASVEAPATPMLAGGGAAPAAERAPIPFAAQAGDSPRAARARSLAREASVRLAEQASGRSGDDEARILELRSRDPIAALVPQALGMPREDQAELLRWALTVPDDRRLAALFDDMTAYEPESRIAEARRRVADLVALLEAEGFSAEPPRAPLARIAPDAPEPDRYPEGFTGKAEPSTGN